MPDVERSKKYDKEFEQEWANIWEPCILTDGKVDLKKVKNEMHDLVFVLDQVGEVYMELTGHKLSKTNYFANVIIGLHNEEIEKSYQEGYDDAKSDHDIKD